jgi:hypothetical protein
MKCVVCGRGLAPWVMNDRTRKQKFLEGARKIDGSDWRNIVTHGP